MKDAGSTGAAIAGGELTAASAGTLVVRASIARGASGTADFTRDFTLTVGLSGWPSP